MTSWRSTMGRTCCLLWSAPSTAPRFHSSCSAAATSFICSLPPTTVDRTLALKYYTKVSGKQRRICPNTQRFKGHAQKICPQPLYITTHLWFLCKMFRKPLMLNTAQTPNCDIPEQTSTVRQTVMQGGLQWSHQVNHHDCTARTCKCGPSVTLTRCNVRLKGHIRVRNQQGLRGK